MFPTTNQILFSFSLSLSLSRSARLSRGAAAQANGAALSERTVGAEEVHTWTLFIDQCGKNIKKQWPNRLWIVHTIDKNGDFLGWLIFFFCPRYIFCAFSHRNWACPSHPDLVCKASSHPRRSCWYYWPCPWSTSSVLGPWACSWWFQPTPLKNMEVS